jgi:hypothetical protein
MSLADVIQFRIFSCLIGPCSLHEPELKVQARKNADLRLLYLSTVKMSLHHWNDDTLSITDFETLHGESFAARDQLSIVQ